MVWHIFKKDWKLLWKLFLALAVIQFLPAIIRVKLGLFGEDPTLEYLVTPLTEIAMAASALLTVAIVQQDSIPSAHEDWLTRPVRRRDLLLAKLLFAVVLVQSAVLSADTFLGLATGFSLGPAMSAALAHNIYWIAILTLPAFMLASITQNMTEAVIAGVLAFCGGSAVLILTIIVRGGQAAFLRANHEVGESWVAQYASQLLIVLGACAVLGIQYSRRNTRAARWLAGTVFLLFVVVQQFLPWKAVFAIERQMSHDPAADRSLALAFDPAFGRFQDPSEVKSADDVKAEAYLPLRVGGLPKDIILHVDKSQVRIVDSHNHVVYRGEGEDWEFRQTEEAKTSVYQKLVLPGSLYESLRTHQFGLSSIIR
jgi:hypothetical protein